MYLPAKEYQVPWWATVLNSFPHLDLTFQRVNSSFDLDDPKYKESLMFWAAAPVLWLLITLLVFLMYFCYRCCQRDSEKKQNVSCLKWTMAVLTLVCCGAIGVGFYGNEEANNGIMYLSGAVNDAMDTISRMKSQTLSIQRSINRSVTEGCNGIKHVYEVHVELSPSLRVELHLLTERALEYAKQIFDSIVEINHKAKTIDLSDLVHDLKDYSFYRRLGMLMVLGWLMLLCLILLVGIGSSSKCTLLLFCAFGIFSLVLCWMSTGLHLGASVGVGDFCVAPHPFFEQLASGQMNRGQMNRGFVQYYVRCDDFIPNPFKSAFNAASDRIKMSNNSLNDAMSTAYKFINKTELSRHVSLFYGGLDETYEAMLSLMALVECTNLHKDYVAALHGICYMALPGILYLIFSAALTGLFFSILVVLASKAWRNVGTKREVGSETCAIVEDFDLMLMPHERRSSGLTSYRKSYVEAEEEDDGPFIPRPSSSSPSYYRYGLVPSRPSSVHDEHPYFPRGRPQMAAVTVQRRSTPPPAYNSNEFYRQYSDVNPPDEYCSRESNA